MIERRAMPSRVRRRSPARRGSVYILVLATVTLITLLGLTTLAASRAARRASTLTNHSSAARIAALSGVELALDRMARVSTWRRDAHLAGGAFIGLTDGPTTLSVRLEDPGDSDLGNVATDPVLIVSTATIGDAQHAVTLLTQPSLTPLSALAGTLYAADTARFDSNSVVRSTGLIASARDMDANSANVYADVESGGLVRGSTYHQSRTSLAPARVMPSRTTVFNTYTPVATTIPLGSIPQVGGESTISRALISPAANPYGPTNALGVYVIDCAGRNLVIRESRIVGTLLIRNPGSNTRIDNGVHWTPRVPGEATLIIDGDISLVGDLTPLSESAAGVNFNPPGTPYMGSEDADTADSYPAIIEGIAYVNGSVAIVRSVAMKGVLLTTGGVDVLPSGSLDMSLDPEIARNPQPAFSMPGDVRAVKGAWSRRVQ